MTDGPGPGGAERPEQRERIVDRADYDPDYDPSAAIVCEVCGADMQYTASCKLRCPRCGYTRDCSDP
jgi:hypothetical protein